MTTDQLVDSSVSTMDPTDAPAERELPEIADPETPEVEATDPEKAEPTAAERAEREAKALRRRVDRLTREKYQTQAELQQLRQRQPQTPQDEQQPTHQLTDQQVNERAEQIAQSREFNKKCNDVAVAGEKKYPGFGERIQELHAEIPIANNDGSPTPFMEALLDADDPAALINHLASNPDVAADLADLTPRQQVRKLALIERDLGEKPTPKPSAAPRPLSPVRPVAASNEPDPNDTEAWIAARNKQQYGR